MGEETFTLTDVPGNRVATEIAILKLDFRVVTKEHQGNDLWTLRASGRLGNQPPAAGMGNAGVVSPRAAGRAGGAGAAAGAGAAGGTDLTAGADAAFGAGAAGAAGAAGGAAAAPGTGAASARAAAGRFAQPMDDVDILARTLWGEGRGGSDAGLEAIATVVMNRLATRGQRFGRTVSEVCLQPSQFSCWNEDDPNRAKILALRGDEADLVRCRAIASRAIAGTLADQTFGADHYHHRGIMPVWARGKQVAARIDDHLFYNNVA